MIWTRIRRFFSIQREISETLKANLQPSYLEVVDESHLHSRGEETHFKITIVSEAFLTLSKIKKHRLIYEELAEITPKVHALTLNCLNPIEFEENDLPESPKCIHNKNSDL